MNQIKNKQYRIQQLTILLNTHSDGMRKAEIARRLGVHRSTVGRYIDELSLSMPIWERHNMIGLEKKSNFDSDHHFTDMEGTFLLILVKLYEKELNIKNPHASSLIRKLSEGFNNVASVLSEELLEIADKLDVEESRFTKGSIESFEKMSEAWLSKMPMSVSYLHKSTGESCNTIYEPGGFLICEDGDGSSNLVVKGLCRRTGKLCQLWLMDFTKIEVPIVNLDIDKGYHNLFCPISEYALSNRPITKNNHRDGLKIKEANHRIKNSLFMASSLIDITLSDLKDQDVQDRSKKLQNRINTIAIIHEQLSNENSGDIIRIDKFLSELVERTLKVLLSETSKVKSRLKVDDFLLSSKIALPFGMIISELITNSLRHAMNNETTLIKINVTKTSGIVKLRYSDGGEGFSLDLDHPGIGLELIQNFCKQIGCTESYKNNNFILEFPA